MLDRRLCLLFLVVIVFSAQAEQEENAGGRVKRFLLKKKATTPVPSSDAIAALITRKPTTSTSSMFGTRTRLSTSSSKGSPFLSLPIDDHSSRLGSCGALNSCKNGGTCRTLPSGRYYCFCSSDYYGNNCEKSTTIDPSSLHLLSFV